ncbi:MAG: hypothetical protein ABI333_14970 [bacterium]
MMRKKHLSSNPLPASPGTGPRNPEPSRAGLVADRGCLAILLRRDCQAPYAHHAPFHSTALRLAA